MGNKTYKMVNDKCKKCRCLQRIDQTFNNVNWLDKHYYDCIVAMTNECIGKDNVYDEKTFNKPYSSYKQFTCFNKKIVLTDNFNSLSFRYLLESYKCDNDNEFNEYMQLLEIS